MTFEKGNKYGFVKGGDKRGDEIREIGRKVAAEKKDKQKAMDLLLQTNDLSSLEINTDVRKQYAWVFKNMGTKIKPEGEKTDGFSRNSGEIALLKFAQDKKNTGKFYEQYSKMNRKEDEQPRQSEDYTKLLNDSTTIIEVEGRELNLKELVAEITKHIPEEMEDKLVLETTATEEPETNICNVKLTSPNIIKMVDKDA